jgi:hypothetical protein
MHARILFLLAPSVLLVTAHAATIEIKDSEGLKRAAQKAKPGDVLRLAPGMYKGGVYLEKIQGAPGQPIVIEGAQPDNPPVFKGGNEALHLIECAHLTLRRLVVDGFPANGINIDDGGTFETPTHHITLEEVTVLNTGPSGNHDALKLSGLDHFLILNCRFEGWGGSAIDMVGCHDGVIRGCTFKAKAGYSQSSAIQAKGGTRAVKIWANFFDHAGPRAINAGGSTGLPYFRPQDADYEALDLEIAGNRFVGGETAVAFATSRGVKVVRNTIYKPEKWVFRILQETQDPRFKPCGEGEFSHNLVVFDEKVRTFVNIGPNTAAQTFKFQGNAWVDLTGKQRAPELPSPEVGGRTDLDPLLKHAGTPEMAVGSPDPVFKQCGADAWREPDR